jgi:hypothetical protein
MTGGLFALGGAVVSTAVKTATMAKQGITIGRNMNQGFANHNHLGFYRYASISV